MCMRGGKMWGQATEDGRYAICYNPKERDLPNRTTPNQEDAQPLEGADIPMSASEYYVDDLKIKSD